jgi:hypothetical protein
MQASLTDSVDIQQQVQSSLSLAESSTITESSSSESANSLRPTLSIPSSESTVIDPIVENTTDEKQTFRNLESDNEHRSEINHSLPSNKRDVIDLWMDNRATDITEYVKMFFRNLRD